MPRTLCYRSYSLYPPQVNGVKLVDIMFSLLCVCLHGENEARDHEPRFRRQNANKRAMSSEIHKD